MNKVPGLLLVIFLLGCTHKPKPIALTLQTLKDTTERMEAFLDSIGGLPQQPIADKVAFGPDSIFKCQKQLDTILSTSDFEVLKKAALNGVIPVKVARRLFGNNEISYKCNEENVLRTYKVGLIPVKYFPFSTDKLDFNEFALCVGDEEHCPNAYLYFFSGNRIIARHDGYSRYGLDLNFFKDKDHKTIVYYKMGFSDGSGEWWNNFFFYKYEGKELVPVLDELQNGNEQPPALRARWLETTVLSTKPLTLKMVYYQNINLTVSLPDTTYFQSSTNIIDDSTIVRYIWDEQSKTLKGNYAQSKLSKAQVMSYYLADNEYLFINSHYGLLKRLLKDDKQSKWVLRYLEKVKTDRLK